MVGIVCVLVVLASKGMIGNCECDGPSYDSRASTSRRIAELRCAAHSGWSEQTFIDSLSRCSEPGAANYLELAS